MRQSHLILSNALIIWASQVLLLVPQLILVPYLIGTIGEAGYGVYALVWSLLMGIDRFERSLQSGVVKYSAAFLAQGRLDQVNRVVSSSFVGSLLLAAVASAAMCTAAVFCEGLSSDLGFALFWVAVLVFFIIPITPYIAVIQSQQRYYVGVMAETIAKYVSLGMIVVWFTLVSASLQALVVIMSAMVLVSRLAQVPIAYRLVPGLQNRPAQFDRGVFRLVVAFGGVTVFGALCGIANTTGVRWLMGVLVSTSFVTHLAIMLMPGALLSQIVSAMTVTIMPATSAYQATGNARMLRELLLRIMRYTTVIVLAGMLVAVLLIEDAIELWVGSEYAFLAPYTLAILASVALMTTTSSAQHMLKGLGKLRTSVCIALAGGVVVPLGLILAVFFTAGNPYLAVTVGLVGGNAVSGMLTLAYAIKAVDAGLRETLLRVYVQPLIAVGAVAVGAFSLVGYGGVDGPLLRASLALTAAVTSFVQMYVVFGTPAERMQAAELAYGVRQRSTAILRDALSIGTGRV